MLLLAAGFLQFQQKMLGSKADDASIKQARAYVGIVKAGALIVRLKEGGLGLLVNIELKNSGTTPAYQLTTWIKKPVVLGKGHALPFDAPRPLSERNGQSIVEPGTSVQINWTVPISESELTEMRSGE